MMVGAFGNSHPADDNVRSLIQKHTADITQQLGASIDGIEVIDYKTQVVAGTNYLIHAKLPSGTHIDVKIYEKLPCYGGETSVTSVTPHH